jgi:hypothetical protein
MFPIRQTVDPPKESHQQSGRFFPVPGDSQYTNQQGIKSKSKRVEDSFGQAARSLEGKTLEGKIKNPTVVTFEQSPF